MLQLVCRLPVKLFISPNLPVDDQNMVQVGLNALSDAELNQQEVAPNAPPEYGRHQLDALYNDINASGYMTRPPSGSSTPFYAQSRNASSENLQSLNGIMDMSHAGSDGQEGHFAPNLLRSRLANLADQGSSRQHRVPRIHHSPSGGNTPHNGPEHDGSLRPAYGSIPSSTGGYFSSHFSASNRSSPPHHSPAHSVPESRRASNDGAMEDDHDVHQADYDMSTLSRVPSYGAAVRTPGLMTPFVDGPPSYFEATSRPPSPGIARPSAAYVRSGSGTPNSNSSAQTLREGGLAPLTAVHNDDARLRLLRARGD